MDKFKPWPRAVDYDDCGTADRVRDKEIERLERALRIATRAYIETKEELESVRESTGLNRPLEFSLFPREIRDEIYRYALVAPLQADPLENTYSIVHRLNTSRCHLLPTTPGLCRINKQTWEEARHILYGENLFYFKWTSNIKPFLKQIGARNEDLLRRIHIQFYIISIGRKQETSDEWPIWFIRECRLKKIVQLKVTIEFHRDNSAETPERMSPVLEEGIKFILNRNREQKSTPRLILPGCWKEDARRFPGHWKIDFNRYYGKY